MGSSSQNLAEDSDSEIPRDEYDKSNIKIIERDSSTTLTKNERSDHSIKHLHNDSENSYYSFFERNYHSFKDDSVGTYQENWRVSKNVLTKNETISLSDRSSVGNESENEKNLSDSE